MPETQMLMYGEIEIRTVCIDDGTWWVLKDVCNVLGLSNSRIVADRLDEDDVSQTYITDSIGRQQQTTTINESGLYDVILRSDKPEAKAFKRCVTHEVLPTIRQSGSYSLPQLSANELILKIAQANVDIERQINDVKNEVMLLDGKIDDAIKAIATPSDWVSAMNSRIIGIAGNTGKAMTLKGKMYAELENIANVSLSVRLKKMRNRMKSHGVTYKEQIAVTKLDIINKDERLRSMFNAIVEQHEAAGD